MSEPSVYIVLINYKNYKITGECIRSLKNIEYNNYKIVVVDNDSQNSSVGELNKEFAENIHLIESKVNTGFSGGNNIGINYALGQGADYVLMLNNDTEVAPDFLNWLVKYSDENTATISKIYYFDMPNKIWYGGGDLLPNKGKTVHYNMGEIDDCQEDSHVKKCTFATGCCILLHKNIINKVGLLDDDFFMYYEDTDYCIRILKNRLSIKYVPQSKIWHKVSSSSGGEASPLSIYYMERNRLYLLKKHRRYFMPLGVLYTYSTRILKLIICIVKKDKNRKYIIEGIKDYYKGVLGKVNI